MKILAVNLWAIIWVALLSPAAVQAATPVGVAPFQYDYDGWITVEAKVNGQGPYKFIVDSGATLSLVFENLATQQVFEPIEGRRRILGLTGQGDLPLQKIGDIEFAGLTFNDHDSVVLEDWAPPRKTPQGVIGLDFFARYIVVFDNAAGEMRLYDPSDPPTGAYKNWARSKMTATDFGQDKGTLYTIRGKIQGKNLTFILDLGASGTFINLSTLRALVDGVRLNPQTGTRVADAFDNRSKAIALVARSLRVGRATWRNHLVTIYDAEVFKELGVNDEPWGLLGTDLLRDRSFVVDFPNEHIYIGKPYKQSRRSGSR